MTQHIEKITPTSNPSSTLIRAVADMATSQTMASIRLARHFAGTSLNFLRAPRRLTMMMQARTHFWSAWKYGAKKRSTRRTTRALIRLDTWKRRNISDRKKDKKLFSFCYESRVAILQCNVWHLPDNCWGTFLFFYQFQSKTWFFIWNQSCKQHTFAINASIVEIEI